MFHSQIRIRTGTNQSINATLRTVGRYDLGSYTSQTYLSKSPTIVLNSAALIPRPERDPSYKQAKSARRSLGERVPLRRRVRCDGHHETRGRASYRRKPRSTAFGRPVGRAARRGVPEARCRTRRRRRVLHRAEFYREQKPGPTSRRQLGGGSGGCATRLQRSTNPTCQRSSLATTPTRAPTWHTWRSAPVRGRSPPMR